MLTKVCATGVGHSRLDRCPAALRSDGRLDLRPGSKAYRRPMGRYRISQLADRVGVPATTLRYYETQGLLLAQRSANGYRTYDDHDIERVRLIATAKALGLSLARIRDLVAVWQDGMCRDVRSQLLRLVADQFDDLDSRLHDLRHVRTHLVAAQEKLDALPSREAPCDPACMILDDHPEAATSPPPDSSNEVIACSLPAGDYADRVRQWRDVLIGTTPQPTPDGAVRTLLDRERLPDLAALIADETRCCPFSTFTLTITHTGVQLDASVPEDARPLLDELFFGTSTGSCAC